MTRTVRVIGAPTDYGANRRGVDMGPSAIRYAGLADQLEGAGVATAESGDLLAPRMEEETETDDTFGEDAKHLAQVRDVNTRLADEVAAVLDTGETPLVLGGDHSIAIGTIRGSAQDAEIGVVWFDAHGDFNTPTTSPSGNIHGMPMAAALGIGDFADTEWANAPRLSEGNVAMVGLRSLDDAERKAIRASDVTAYPMSEIDERGINAVVDDAIDVATAGTDGVHVSFDVDWLDPKEAPGVGTPVRGGATYREAHAALELLAERDADDPFLRSMDIVEVNPILDEHNETAQLATELAASAFGKRII
jgi:arginase